MIRLSCVFAYYRNAGMLSRQMCEWAAYPDALKSQVEMIVVDDSSPEPAIDVPRPNGLPALRIGRLADVSDPTMPPWRQDAARNRGAHDAIGDWLFLTDIDHVLPADSLRTVFALIETGRDVVYSFQRLDAPHMIPKRDARGNVHPHPNTYLMTKARYWTVGGYDEEYCGIYGTDGYWRRDLLAQSTLVQLEDVPIVRYPREVIPDASTQKLLADGRNAREAARDNPHVARRIQEKRAAKLPAKVLVVPYRQQFPETAA